MLQHYLDVCTNFIGQLREGNNNLKQRAIDEYYAALKMPRKKKKIAKKSAISLYNIACWGEDLTKDFDMLYY